MHESLNLMATAAIDMHGHIGRVVGPATPALDFIPAQAGSLLESATACNIVLYINHL